MCNPALLLSMIRIKIRYGRLLPMFIAAFVFAVHADELHLAGRKKPLQGIFLGISERAKVSFQVYGEDAPRDFAAGNIDGISLDKPVKVRCFLKRNRTQARNGLFNGMMDGKFQIRFSGEQKDQEISLLQLHKLEVDLDMKHYMTRMEKARVEKAKSIADERQKAEDFLSPGKISVLHFTSPELSVNSRQGNLAKRLCEDNSRSAEYVQILVDSLDSKLAKANALESLPQFWFYNSRSRLSAKLTGRFTDDDIEQAFRKASRGR